jgi:hypothetical protein
MSSKSSTLYRSSLQLLMPLLGGTGSISSATPHTVSAIHVPSASAPSIHGKGPVVDVGVSSSQLKEPLLELNSRIEAPGFGNTVKLTRLCHARN